MATVRITSKSAGSSYEFENAWVKETGDRYFIYHLESKSHGVVIDRLVAIIKKTDVVHLIHD